jgi:hypothetical protein
MRNNGPVLLTFAGILLSSLGFAQQPQPAQPQPAQTAQPAQKPQPRNAPAEVGNTPTPNDMYCSGFITTERVPDKIFVAAGHNTPDQSRYAGKSDVIFLHGPGLKEGERYQIVRHVRDTNHYEI